MRLLQESGVEIKGSNAVVIGRSKIVGSPMAQLLIWNDATVTLCHKQTRNLPDIVRKADILVVAIGQPGFIQRDWIKPRAVIIDCGISSVDDASRKAGYRLVGDVDYDQVKEVASFITPGKLFLFAWNLECFTSISLCFSSSRRSWPAHCGHVD